MLFLQHAADGSAPGALPPLPLSDDAALHFERALLAAEAPASDPAADAMAGRVLPVEGVAQLTVDAILANRLYVLPHEESRDPIRRRFERIDRTFDEQP